MARIKQLSPHEAQKIAAGEVVERPANVVKELVENALDAGATQITIYLQDAGKSLIRIIDNGFGMNEEDAQLCFKHHATSKITRVDDLSTLTTFAFRGEALSSICAVSNVTLITKEHAPVTGTKVSLQQGALINLETISCNSGTDISVADLFFNVPARKKFLKTNETETRQIILLFQALCLDYLHVHFKLFIQNSLHYNCPATTDLQQRVAQLWDHTIAQQIIPLATEKNGIQIHGIISNHTYSRYDRSSIFFFVNKRWIKNHSLTKALLKGYMNVLQPDKFPLACISISIDPALVDINIHPRKEEVQFLNPRIIEQMLQSSVKENLENHLSAQLNKKVAFANNESPIKTDRGVYKDIPTVPNTIWKPALMPAAIYHVENTIPVQSLPITEPFSAKKLTEPEFFSNYQIIGQFHKTYILIEQEDSLFLVDQHAAHERILYELFSKNFEEVATIGLLFPQIIMFNSEELQLLAPHLQIFINNHITLEIISENQVVIKAIPAHLKEINLEELIRQTIGWIIEYQKIDSQEWYQKVHEKLHAQMACKAAVKAGDILTIEQMQKLLNDLEKTEHRFSCPHGRPTGWKLPLYEIERKFKRKL